MLSISLVSDLIRRSRPRRPTLVRIAAFAVAGCVLVVALIEPSGLWKDRYAALFVFQIALLAFVAWVWTRARRHRDAAAQLEQAWEAIHFRDWASAEDPLIRSLQRPMASSSGRLRGLLGLAAVADGEKQFEVARHVLESILRERIADRGLEAFVRAALAHTLLQTDQLRDAVEMLDRLRREDLPAPLRARVECTELWRLVRMGQDSAVDQAEERRALFRRHLGTRAGCGYGLLAAAYDRAGREEQAAALWRDATLLIRPAELADRFPELRTVASKYTASEWPI